MTAQEPIATPPEAPEFDPLRAWAKALEKTFPALDQPSPRPIVFNFREPARADQPPLMTHRTITIHQTPDDQSLDITCLRPGTYRITPRGFGLVPGTDLRFKSADHPQGITIESLLALCADRLQQFQQGPTACAENATVITNLRASIATLHGRTRRREVEGTTGTAAP